MKKSIFTMVLSLFLIFFTIEVNAQQNFIVSLKMPPPGTLNVTDFWNITVTNNSGSDLSGYLVGTAKEDKDGMIAKGTTVPIMLKKGINNIKIKDLPKTPDVEYIASDPRYKESLIRQGKFPSGNYEICVKVISASTNEELGSDCLNQEVIETGLLSLINPADGEEIDSKVPLTFSWSSGGKIPEGGYTLKICEVMKNQTPEIAMKSNKAWFEQKGIKSTTFAYPNSAKGFEEGKKYVWMVRSGNAGSEIISFSIINKLIIPIMTCKLDNLELNVSFGSNGILTICGTAGIDDLLVRRDASGKKIEVDNLSNGSGMDYSFAFEKVKSIHVFLFAGDDLIIFDDTYGALGVLLPLEINAGDGDNTVIGSTGTLNPSEIADLGNTITKLKKVLETANDIREHVEQLNRRAGELAVYYEMKFLKEAERFSEMAPKQMDSIVEALNTLPGRRIQMIESEQGWYISQAEQIEKSFLKMQEKNETYVNNVFSVNANKFMQRFEKNINGIDSNDKNEKKFEDLSNRMEIEIDSFAAAYSKLNLPGDEDLAKIDIDIESLREKLSSIGDSLLAWSEETEFMSDYDDNNPLDTSNTLVIGNSRFEMSDKELMDGIDSLQIGAEAIESEVNALLENIRELIGKIGEGNRTPDLRGTGCNFETTNTITGGGIIIGTAANDDITGSSLAIEFIFGLGGSDRIHGGYGIDIMFGDWPSSNGSSDDMFGEGNYDFMMGNGGDDCMSGGDSIDLMLGNSGNDIMHGNGGTTITFNIYMVTVTIDVGDWMFGMEDNDEMYGEESLDVMSGGSGKDAMHGGDCQDFMFGGTDDDDMWGEDGGGVTINSIPVHPGNLMLGNPGLDKMWGGKHRDFIIGNQDNDIMNGGDGNDLMLGNGGKDEEHGNDGMDFIFGGTEDDDLSGDDGFDFMSGDQDNDKMNGNKGMDFMWGRSGKDVMRGDDGSDFMSGGTDDDKMNGDDGFDLMLGRKGDDIMDGDDLPDIMFGGSGKDMMHGNTGLDLILGGKDEDSMWGDRGFDIMLGNGENDMMHGNDGFDIMFGNECNDMMWGDEGLDFMMGNQNIDYMFGGPNADIMLGNEDDDCMNGDDGVDFMSGNAGNDVIFGNTGLDAIWGGSGNDQMDGGDGPDAMFGGQGNDGMFGGNSFDWMRGNENEDAMDGGDGIDIMEGNDGNDVIHGRSNIDWIYGGTGDDCLSGNDGLDLIFGADGNDRMLGGNGLDIMSGGNGSELMEGGDDGDAMLGGNDNDHMMGSNGRDGLWGQGGDDILDGGNNSDIISGGPGSDQGCGGPAWDFHSSCSSWTQSGSCGFSTFVCSDVTPLVQCGKKVPDCIITDSCKCQGGRKDMNVSVAPSGGAATYIDCGGTYNTTTPNNITFNFPINLCTPQNCDAIYQWNVSGPLGISTGTGNTFPYNFTTGGTYVATVYSYCGGHKCDSCRITIIAEAESDCSCGSWNQVTLQQGSGVNVTLPVVNHQVMFNQTLSSTLPITLTPVYNCNSTNCSATFEWKSYYTGLSSVSPITFDFSAPGNFRMFKITPTCGNNVCKDTVNVKVFRQ